MKKFRILFSVFILATGLLVVLGGCKRFLDRKPLGATLDDLSAGGVEQQVFGLYSAIGDYDIGQAFGGIIWLGMNEFRADDSEKGSDLVDGADWVASFENFNYDKDHWCTNQYWDMHYRLIHLANNVLQTVDSLQLNDAATQIFIAEARFFRAYAYFDLVRTYGRVPKIDFKIYNPEDANIPKVDNENEIYAFINEDLQFAGANLPLEWEAKYKGRATSGAAKTLQAKAFMQKGDFASAAPLLQQVIQSNEYSLYPVYWQIFKDAGENCSESIFEIQNTMGANGIDDHGSWYATSQGIRGKPDASEWNLGWGWNTPTTVFVNAFEPGDIRRASTILFGGQSDDPSTGGYGKTIPPAGQFGLVRDYWNKKVYADPQVQQFTGYLHGAYWINQRVMRFADVILMSAEARNELGGAMSADSVGIKDLVNSVRQRAGLGAINYVSQAAMRAAIKQERRVEFGLEGQRFFDLVRWGDATSVLAPLGYVPKNKYYPLPKSAIDKSNGVLIQNPDYP